MEHVTWDAPAERIEKPWGHETIWARTDRYVGKILFIRKGQKLSLQFHDRKDESIYLHSGLMRLTVQEREGDPRTGTMRPGDRLRIRPGTIHRMEALEDCQVLEASTPELDDVVRLEDAYGRAPAGKEDGAP